MAGLSYEQILRNMAQGKYDKDSEAPGNETKAEPETKAGENTEQVDNVPDNTESVGKESETVPENKNENAAGNVPDEGVALESADDGKETVSREAPAGTPQALAQPDETATREGTEQPAATDEETALRKDEEPPVMADDDVEGPPVSIQEEAKPKPAAKPKPYSPEKERKRNEAVRTKPTKMGRPSDNVDSRVQIPLDLVNMCRGQIPEALNNSDAVAAWIYAKSDKTVDVPDYIKKISTSYTGDQTTNVLKDINDNLAAMRQQNYRLGLLTDGRVQELWYMIAYLMLERMDEIHTPALSKMDLALPVFDTLRDMLRVQFATERNRINNSKKDRYRSNK